MLATRLKPHRLELLHTKESHCYILRFRCDQRIEALQASGRWAGQVGHPYSWYDAGAIGMFIRSQTWEPVQ